MVICSFMEAKCEVHNIYEVHQNVPGVERSNEEIHCSSEDEQCSSECGVAGASKVADGLGRCQRDARKPRYL